MSCEVGGTNEPIFDWQYAGLHYRISLVAGLLRFEQELSSTWYLVKPSHDTIAMMVCAGELITKLRHAEQVIADLRADRVGVAEAGS